MIYKMIFSLLITTQMICVDVIGIYCTDKGIEIKQKSVEQIKTGYIRVDNPNTVAEIFNMLLLRFIVQVDSKVTNKDIIKEVKESIVYKFISQNN